MATRIERAKARLDRVRALSGKTSYGKFYAKTLDWFVLTNVDSESVFVDIDGMRIDVIGLFSGEVDVSPVAVPCGEVGSNLILRGAAFNFYNETRATLAALLKTEPTIKLCTGGETLATFVPWLLPADEEYSAPLVMSSWQGGRRTMHTLTFTRVKWLEARCTKQKS